MNNLDLSKEKQEYATARTEFQQKQKELKTGYLVLTGKQVLHFANKKEWESAKENYPREIQYSSVDYEMINKLQENSEE